MCESSADASVVAAAELSAAPPGRTARLILDLGYADAAAAAVARELATGVLAQIQALLADPAPALPGYLRDALAALAGALSEQTAERTAGAGTVTALDTPLARAWHAHPAGRDRPAPPPSTPAAPTYRGDASRRGGELAVSNGDLPSRLIGFHCPVCGLALPAEESRPVPAPVCAGSPARTSKKARTGRQHAPTPMQPLVIR